MTKRKVLFWIAVLYFAEGLPFGIAYDVWPVFFRVHGVSLREIGLMSLLSLPWTWKLVWAPLVDRWGCRQHWITASLFVLGATTLAIVPQDASSPSFLMWGLLLLFTTASATQDIAIDAYAVDVATPKTTGSINGARVAAARVAMLAGGGGFLILADFTGWKTLWVALAVILFALAAFAWMSPRVPLDSSARRHAIRPVLTWVFRWQMVPVLLFVLLFKVGDSTLGRMVKPFWVDRGYSLTEIGAISVTLGTALTILGALAGGWIVDRIGIFRSLLWLGLAQLVSNLGYVRGGGRRSAAREHLRRLDDRELHPGPRDRGLPVLSDEPVRQGACRHPVRHPVGDVRPDPRCGRRLHRNRRREPRLRGVLRDHDGTGPAGPRPAAVDQAADPGERRRLSC